MFSRINAQKKRKGKRKEVTGSKLNFCFAYRFQVHCSYCDEPQWAIFTVLTSKMQGRSYGNFHAMSWALEDLIVFCWWCCLGKLRRRGLVGESKSVPGGWLWDFTASCHSQCAVSALWLRFKVIALSFQLPVSVAMPVTMLSLSYGC